MIATASGGAPKIGELKQIQIGSGAGDGTTFSQQQVIVQTSGDNTFTTAQVLVPTQIAKYGYVAFIDVCLVILFFGEIDCLINILNSKKVLVNSSPHFHQSVVL